MFLKSHKIFLVIVSFFLTLGMIPYGLCKESIAIENCSNVSLNENLDEPQKEVARKLLEEIEATFKSKKIIGLSFALIRDQEVLLCKNYGFENLQHQIPTSEKKCLSVCVNFKNDYCNCCYAACGSRLD